MDLFLFWYILLIIKLKSLMESQAKQVIHLYEFEQQSINEKQMSKLILDTLKPYFGDKCPEIKIRGRPHKYWAYFEVDPQTAAKLSELKTIKIGNDTVHVGRYYHDYQIFINKIISNNDSNTIRQQIIDYFQQFGEVVDVVVTEPAENKRQDSKHRHCYIKMKDQKTIDRVVLAKLHKLDGQEIKPVRTFCLDEDKESDKKLFLKFEGTLQSIEDFEQKTIEYLMKHGKIRERPKVQSMAAQKYKMIITYTNAKSAASAIQGFSSSDLFNEYQKKNINLILTYFYTKQNKIYVSGLKQINEKTITDAFGIFGQITEVTVSKNKNNPFYSAVIGYANENDYKMALIAYNEQPKVKALFGMKPFVTIFMTSQQKKSYNEMKKKQSAANQPARTTNYPPMGYGFPEQMNPQFRMPMMNTGMGMPGQNMPMMPNYAPMQPGNLNMPNMMPNMPMHGGQFNQPPMGGRGQYKPSQPRNN